MRHARAVLAVTLVVLVVSAARMPARAAVGEQAPASSAVAAPASNAASFEQARQLVRRYYAEISDESDHARRLAACNALLSTGFAFYPRFNAGGQEPKAMRGAEAHDAFLEWHHDVYRDQRWSIEEWFGDGRTVLARYVASGTFVGRFLTADVPAPGKPAVIRGIDLFRIEDGRIVELRRLFDAFDVLQQIR